MQGWLHASAQARTHTRTHASPHLVPLKLQRVQDGATEQPVAASNCDSHVRARVLGGGGEGVEGPSLSDEGGLGRGGGCSDAAVMAGGG
jgi:hypothetical protein